MTTKVGNFSTPKTQNVENGTGTDWGIILNAKRVVADEEEVG